MTNVFKFQQNDLKVRDEEHKQLEKMVDMERQKNSSLISQLDELTSINTQLTMQFSDAKRKLISLELVSWTTEAQLESSLVELGWLDLT